MVLVDEVIWDAEVFGMVDLETRTVAGSVVILSMSTAVDVLVM